MHVTVGLTLCCDCKTSMFILLFGGGVREVDVGLTLLKFAHYNLRQNKFFEIE